MTAEDLRYNFEERAGICQDSGMSKEEAEAMAEADRKKSLERAELIAAGEA